MKPFGPWRGLYILVMQTVPHTIAPLPLHADLICTSDARRGHQRKYPHPLLLGWSNLRPAKWRHLAVRELLRHVGGHLKETREHPVCLLHTSICPRNPTRSIVLGEAYRTASKTLAMTRLLCVRSDSIYYLPQLFVRVQNRRVLHRSCRSATHAAFVAWRVCEPARHG